LSHASGKSKGVAATDGQGNDDQPTREDVDEDGDDETVSPEEDNFSLEKWRSCRGSLYESPWMAVLVWGECLFCESLYGELCMDLLHDCPRLLGRTDEGGDVDLQQHGFLFDVETLGTVKYEDFRTMYELNNYLYG
jgi:hypothetical protein